MSEPKQDLVPLAWIKLNLLSNDTFENDVFGDEDQLIQLFAASFKKYPYLIGVTDKAKEIPPSKNPKNN